MVPPRPLGVRGEPFETKSRFQRFSEVDRKDEVRGPLYNLSSPKSRHETPEWRRGGVTRTPTLDGLLDPPVSGVGEVVWVRLGKTPHRRRETSLDSRPSLVSRRGAPTDQVRCRTVSCRVGTSRHTFSRRKPSFEPGPSARISRSSFVMEVSVIINRCSSAILS